MSILRNIVGIASELFTFKDPYDMPIEPKITGTRKDGCNTVIEVQASSYREVERLTSGVNFPGRTVHTRVGPNKWEVHQEEQ